MRGLVLALVAAFGLMAGACSRNEGDGEVPTTRRSTIVEPEKMGMDVVPQEEPAVARSQWRAGSDTARTASNGCGPTA